MSAGISIREFARRDGCSDKVVRTAIAAKKLKTLPDGSLDEALVKTGWRKGNRGADKGADEVRTVRTSPRKSAPPARAADTIDAAELDDDEEDQAGDLIARLLSGEVLDLAMSERAKASALALRQMVNARRDAGALVEIELAERVLFEGARRFRDAVANWPTRVAPLLAADLDVPAEKVVEALNAHVHELLQSLGQPEPDFSA